MPVSYISDAQAAAASVSLPSFVAGDLAIVHAYRNGSTSPPSLPAGWDDWLSTTGANTNSRRIGTRVLQSGDTTTGTWTNATAVQVIVLRGQDVSSPRGVTGSGGSNTTTLTTPALSGLAASNNLVVAFAGSKATNANTVTLSSTTDAGSSQGALNLAHATEVSSWSSRGYSATVNAGGNRMDAVEILGAVLALPRRALVVPRAVQRAALY